jgi:hypothetical protein
MSLVSRRIRKFNGTAVAVDDWAASGGAGGELL